MRDSQVGNHGGAAGAPTFGKVVSDERGRRIGVRSDLESAGPKAQVNDRITTMQAGFGAIQE